MLHVYFTNHQYFSQETFNTFEDALTYVKGKCFEAAICAPYRKDQPHRGCEVLAFWSPIGGLKMHY